MDPESEPASDDALKKYGKFPAVYFILYFYTLTYVLIVF